MMDILLKHTPIRKNVSPNKCKETSERIKN